MQIIGLTGGIATGKSTVSRMFRELGADVIDADQIAREVVAPGSPALIEIQRRFPTVIAADGQLERAKLGTIIFADPKQRGALNAILHPRIHHAFLAKKSELAGRGVAVALYDAALLIENELHHDMDGVILVTAPRELQIARLAQRNGLTRQEAEARLSAQMPLEDKTRFARWIIDNSGDLASTRAQVEKLWASIQARAAADAKR